jgi:hydroxypyruvate reductase
MGDRLPLVAANGKALARRILERALAAIEVRHAMLSRIRLEGKTLRAGSESLELCRPPRAVAFGKAANRMAATLDEILGGRFEAGVVVSPSVPPRPLPRVVYFQGGHPLPNAGSLLGAEAAIELLSGLTENDTVIYLISGGGSALFEKPLDPQVTLADLIELNRLLVGCGLPIEQINVIRKHLSAVKGGRLAAQAYPAWQLTIYISDVPDDTPSMVASGPTMPDESTAEQCYELAETNSLIEKLPATIRKHFEARTLEETPKLGGPQFARSRYFCLLRNQDALEAARAAAEDLGFIAEIDPADCNIHYRRVVEETLPRLDAMRLRHPGKPLCLIQGGEVISPVTGGGMGGRNQALVLCAAEAIAGSGRAVLSAGTDGRDGNSPAAGAVADGSTLARAKDLGLDAAAHLASSDSYRYFKALEDAIETGGTDNNVRDVRVWLDFE